MIEGGVAGKEERTTFFLTFVSFYFWEERERDITNVPDKINTHLHDM